MTKVSKKSHTKQSCKTGDNRGVLNVSLEEILKDKRSLTRIVNLVLNKSKSRKFSNKDLLFNLIIETENKFTSNDTYINIYHTHKTHFNQNWKIFIFKDDFCGLKIRLLQGVNYTWVNNDDLIGKFIRSKKWVNQEYISYEIRKLQNQINSLNILNRTLETFCS